MPSALRVKAAGVVSEVKPPEIYLLNRFLHTVKEKRIEIEEILSYLPDPPLSTIDLEPSSIEHAIYFIPGISKSNVSYYTFTIPKITFRFFEFPRPDTDALEWEKISPLYFNLSNVLLLPLNKSLSFKEDLFPEIKILYLKAARLISTTEKIELWDESSNIENLEVSIDAPHTTEYISKFAPEIQKVLLLNSNDILQDTFILDNDKFSLNVSISFPAVKKLNTLQITNDYPMMDYRNLSLACAETFSFEGKELHLNVDFIAAKSGNKNLLSEKEFEEVNKYLEPVYELSDEIMSEILFPLPDYQQKGAKFLFHSPFAMLCDEFGLGKEIQAIMALKMLLRIRAVRKVLVITTDFQEANYQWNNCSQFGNIWEVNFKLLLSGFTYKFYDDSGKFIEEENFNNNLIHCVSYNILEESFIKGTLPQEKLGLFDSIILDDFSEDLIKLDSIKLVFKKTNARCLWVLSSFNPVKIKGKLIDFYSSPHLKVMERDKSILPLASGSRINRTYFLEPENEAKENFDNIFKKGKKQLDDLVQFGNLLRLQANAFQVIQEIQRTSNLFNEILSPKFDLLKYHIERIFEREDRILIYSQFEKSGLFEINGLLNKLGIEHISFRQRDSQNDINDKLNLSSSNKGKLIYLSNMKPNSIKFKFPKVSHLINFDNWWSPPTRWSLEEKLDSGGKPLTVINYFIKGTAEEKLLNELYLLGLNDKNIIDTIQPQKFYQIYDDMFWGNLFDLPYDIFRSTGKSEYKLNNMIDLVNKSKLFLRALGYNEINSQASINNNSYNLSAVYGENKVITKCIYSHHLNSEFIKSLVFNINDSNNKIFIITNGSISFSNLVLPANVSLIDGQKLKKYLELLKAN